jgi:TPR repeat protein
VEIYSDGKLRDRDPRQVARWYLRAAELGDRQSQYETGSSYAMGYGVRVDFTQAKYWLRLAAADGHRPAAILLSHLESPLFRLVMRVVGRFRLAERFGKYEF